LVEVLCGLVEKYNIPPELFQLELTESAYTTNQNSIRNMMTTLQEKGFVVMMDDFGSGYSSLNMLKDIRVDVLKFDLHFLRNSNDIERSRKIIKSLMELAKELEMPAISEGVETEEQVEFLKGIGCDLFQGYYFAKPMDIGKFEERYLK
jgi:EAL domain-containing protein (putative c-di-GMP-specific phosphodiesterase class I)